MRSLLIPLLLMLPASAAHAQEPSIPTTYLFYKELQLETFATKAAREQYLKSLAAQFQLSARASPLKPDEIAAISEGIKNGSLTANVVPARDLTGLLGSRVLVRSIQITEATLPDGTLAKSHRNLEADIDQNAFNNVRQLILGSLLTVLQQFAAVQLAVTPAPPRDYTVKINGEDVQATEQGLYRVSPGNVTVIVTRAAKRPCNWRGQIGAGKQQVVSCAL